MTIDLFPETVTAPADMKPVEWNGSMLDKYGHPRATVRLIPVWHQHQGWVVGWFAMLDKALDEWHPANPNAWRQLATYPWHRLDEMPRSRSYAVACGQAARGVRLVVAQLQNYCGQDLLPDVVQLQDQIEDQARAWLCEGSTV